MAKTLDDLLNEKELMINEQVRREAAYYQKIYEEHPVLLRFEQQKKLLMVEPLGDIVRNPSRIDDIKASVQEKLMLLNREIASYQKKHGIQPYRHEYTCTKCEDTGWIEQNLCVCTKERMYREVFGGDDITSLQGSFSGFSPEVFQDEEQRARMEQYRGFLEKYANTFPDVERRQLIFCGDAGLGKTYLLSALLKAIYQKEQDICYIGAARLFDYFHKVRLGEVALTRPLYEVRVLAIDDLGSEPMTQNVTREVLFELIEGRQKAGLFTFIVTNNSFSQLKERYTERVSSRLLSNKDSYVLRFGGKDLRLS